MEIQYLGNNWCKIFVKKKLPSYPRQVIFYFRGFFIDYYTLIEIKIDYNDGWRFCLWKTITKTEKKVSKSYLTSSNKWRLVH